MKAIACIFSVILLSACTLNEFDPKEWAIDPVLKLSESSAVLGSQDEKYSFSYKTNYKNVDVRSNHPEWVNVNVNSLKSTIELHVSPNMSAEQRVAIINVYISRGSKYLSKDFVLYQVGGKWDIVEGTDIKLRWSYDISDSQKEIIKNQIRELVFVEGGTFMMGTQKEDKNAANYSPYNNEANPLHPVTLSSYYIGKYELTQEQWTAVMGTNPSRFNGGRKPVENITWEDAFGYISRLSNLTGLSFSLPTSAQWEYAARGGKYSMDYYYPGSDDYTEVAHVIPYSIPEASTLFSTKEVGTLRPNELGLYDMAGNVSEMCYDWYGEIPNEPQTDPTGPNTGKYHVVRGGDLSEILFIDMHGNCGYVSKPIISNSYAGFRIVLSY